MLRKNNIMKLKSRVSEEFRSLRTNIKFSLPEDIKSIVITSTVQGEGKTTIISNLGVSMARNGKKVVIIDCNFREPSIAKVFSLPNNKGLISALLQESNLEEYIIKTNINNLSVITSGNTFLNSSELLGGGKMKDILKELTSRFDLVLIDTPPVLYISDAQVLSSLSQGTIIVNAYGEVEKEELIEVKEKIEKVGGKIIGVIMNKYPKKLSPHKL